jgi:hypothetical protein
MPAASAWTAGELCRFGCSGIYDLASLNRCLEQKKQTDSRIPLGRRIEAIKYVRRLASSSNHPQMTAHEPSQNKIKQP